MFWFCYHWAYIVSMDAKAKTYEGVQHCDTSYITTQNPCERGKWMNFQANFFDSNENRIDFQLMIFIICSQSKRFKIIFFKMYVKCLWQFEYLKWEKSRRNTKLINLLYGENVHFYAHNDRKCCTERPTESLLISLCVNAEGQRECVHFVIVVTGDATVGCCECLNISRFSSKANEESKTEAFEHALHIAPFIPCGSTTFWGIFCSEISDRDMNGQASVACGHAITHRVCIC